MAKFKVGDRVRLKVNTPDSSAGMEGVITEATDAPWVHFDKPTRYAGGYSKCPFLVNGDCDKDDCVDEDELELVENYSPTKVRDRAHIERIVWSDGIELIGNDSIKIGDETKTRAEWKEHIKLIRRALGRKGVKAES